MSGVRELAGLRILVVDDEDDLRRGLRLLLAPTGAEILEAECGAAALDALRAHGADLVLTDLQMPGISGTELLAEIKVRAPGTVVVILTGFGTIQTAVWCLEHGAAHFLTKPFDNDEIVRLVTRTGRQILAVQREAHASAGPVVIGEHPRMRAALELIERVAASPVPVLLEGETGSGKEVFARRLHARSRVAERPFLAVNAAALPDTLLESELFGHERGAFTGADRPQRGLFEEARGGTVFLDEVASMSLAFQGKLLRVLEEKRVRPLGAARDVPVEFRLVAATNRDLAELVRAGAFREDLYYRLRVVAVRVPPLRERRSDVVPLALHFLARAAERCLGAGAPVPELSPPAAAALEEHDWPGNVRELENAVQRAVVVCASGRILPHHFGLDHGTWSVSDDVSGGYEEGKRRALERFQREFVVRALGRTGGNVTRAAEECGLTRAALQRILRQLDIDRAAFEG